ncbi:unnamed protein product, partial [Candidula unifasciata]
MYKHILKKRGGGDFYALWRGGGRTSSVTISGAVKRGIETEVLGPLRIWHIIGISLTILSSAVFMLCCCCNFRVPRTRQQIEENYLKRKINKRYLHLLERNPEKLITKR